MTDPVPPMPPDDFPISEPPPEDETSNDEAVFPGGIVDTALSLGAATIASDKPVAKHAPAKPASAPIPAAQTSPGDQPGEDKTRIEMSTVLYRPVQYDPEGNPSSAHWVSLKIWNNGNPQEALAMFEDMMKHMWIQGYIERPPASAYSPQGFSAAAPPAPAQVIAPPNKPAASPDTIKSAPNPTAPPAAPAGGGSDNTGRSPLHTLTVQADGTVEFKVGAFNWPFKDKRYGPSMTMAVEVFAKVFDASTGFTLEHLRTPKLYNLEGHGYFVDWEKVSKNGKTYYNVVKVLRQQ